VKTITTTTALFILAAISLIGVIVLTATSKVVPTDLWAITLALVGSVAGVAIPRSSTAAPATTPTLVPPQQIPGA
jgi:hypothetical protein